MTTTNISPKLTWPAIALVGIGAALLITGALTGSSELLAAGGALVAATGLVQVPLAHEAPPGAVAVEVGVPQDELLPAEALKQAKKADEVLPEPSAPAGEPQLEPDGPTDEDEREPR